MLGMGTDFYIKFLGSCDNYDLVADILYDPDTILYDDDGTVNIQWKAGINCLSFLLSEAKIVFAKAFKLYLADIF